MNITRWEPFRELEDLSERLNRVFGTRAPARLRDDAREEVAAADWVPRVDVTEDPERYRIKVELPEVKKADVKIHVQEGVLTIRGERKQETEEEGKRFHRIERFYGSFMRTFLVPNDADEEKLTAEYRDGMLYITLPKTEKAKAKSVEIQIK